MADESEILFEHRGRAGIVTLNRPKALNALSHHMIRQMHAQLRAWADDPAVTRVVLRSASERAFCAGGDIRAMYELGRAGRVEEALSFWADEYPLNLATALFSKPFISLVDGICMGGGVGISGHGRYRVAAEKITFAMPEVAIGLIPDVGGSFVLPRLPGWMGTWLALTGARIGLADAMALDLYTHHIPRGRWDDLLESLVRGDEVERLLARFSVRPPASKLPGLQELIDRVFAGGTMEAVLAALDHAAGGQGTEADFARAQAAVIRTKSPTSLKLTLEQMKAGATLDLAGGLQLEYRVVSRIMRGHDFYEGVRAVLVDKDNAPRWNPASLEAVDEASIAACFAPLPEELAL